jgi:hypothetical protein
MKVHLEPLQNMRQSEIRLGSRGTAVQSRLCRLNAEADALWAEAAAAVPRLASLCLVLQDIQISNVTASQEQI